MLFKPFRDLSLRWKVILYGCVVSILSLLLVCAGFLANDVVTFRQSYAAELRSTANILGATCASALAFHDVEFARKTLAGLEARPTIAAACLYAGDGTIFAQYVRDGGDYEFPTALPKSLPTFRGMHVEISQPVSFAGNAVGTIWLREDLGVLSARLKRYAFISVCALLLGTLAAVLLSARFQRVITKPILELVRVANVVAKEHDYSQMAIKTSSDELGLLADTFNEMLTEIQERELRLRESEERFRHMFESSQDAIMLLNGSHFIDANDAALHMFACSRDELLEKHPSEASPPTQPDGRNSRQAADEEIAKAMRDGHNFFEWTHRRLNGEDFPAEVLLGVMTLGGERVVHSTVRDITDRKRAEEELADHRDHLEALVEKRTAELAVAKDRAEESDHLKSAFLAVMSHELRTPLNSIIGFTGIVLQGLAGPLSEEQAKQLGMVQGSARHLLELINDVLDISKIEAGEVEIVPKAFDVREAIKKAAEKVALSAEKKGLALTVDVAPEVGRITSDRRRFEQILVNLVNNAVKFTEHGEVRIECFLNEDRLVTCVKDTGIGINPEDLGKLFKEFRQVGVGLGRPQEGTGLGLSICKKLVALLGGDIRVESKPGQGSAFTFALPIKAEG